MKFVGVVVIVFSTVVGVMGVVVGVIGVVVGVMGVIVVVGAGIVVVDTVVDHVVVVTSDFDCIFVLIKNGYRSPGSIKKIKSKIRAYLKQILIFGRDIPQKVLTEPRRALQPSDFPKSNFLTSL